jgi:hypothetical protein
VHPFLRVRWRRPCVRRGLAAIAGAVSLGVAAPASADLGRLFFTPQQRAELDKRRANPVVEEQPAAQESALTLDGYVRRSDGRTTTWVNGVPRYDTRAARSDGRVTVDEPGGKVTLKVGQTADLTAAAVRDPLAGGSVQPAPPPRP